MEDVKARVKGKFESAYNTEQPEIKRSIGYTELIDGKIKADFEISGLPTKDKDSESGMYYDGTHKRIPKIFDTVEEYADHAKDFFKMSDEEIKKLAKS